MRVLVFEDSIKPVPATDSATTLFFGDCTGSLHVHLIEEESESIAKVINAALKRAGFKE